ncbi:MAG: hypothetical protein ACYCY0_13900 [Acidithiobacillus ferrivorans]
MEKIKTITLSTLWYLFFYTIISIIYFSPLYHSIENSIFTPGGDQYSFIWFLTWWPRSISNGINPFISNYVWPPDGINMAWVTSIPTVALIMWPVTTLMGPIASWNILALLAAPLDAFSAFLLLRYLYHKDIPAFLGGYLFGFSSYVLGQLQGHLNLDLVFIIPIIVLFFMKRSRDEIRPIPYIVIMAILFCLQVGISTEVFATSVTFGTISTLIFMTLVKDKRTKLASTLGETFISLILSIVLIFPFFYYIILGMNNAPAFPGNPLFFSADIVNYFIPTPITKIGGNIFSDIAANFVGNYCEDGAYFGIPLLIIIALSLRDTFLKENRIGLSLSIILIMLFIFSLGQNLHVNGVITDIYLPWKIFTYLPLIKNALPIRFTMYVFLVGAIVITGWMTMIKSTTYRTIAVIISLFFIVPNIYSYSWKRVVIPAHFSTSKRLVGKNLLILPFGYTGASMLWQAESNMRFKLVGGYTGSVPDSYSNYAMTSHLLAGEPGKNFYAKFNAYCHHFKVNYVLTCPGTPAPLKHAIDHTANLNGWLVEKSGECEIYQSS